MPDIGPLQIIIVLIIVLLVFGPKRLPEMGRSLGKGIREFKDSITGNDDEEEPPRAIERDRAEAARPLEGEVVHERKP
jgi:sec-independent protein translocase protein TatA